MIDSASTKASLNKFEKFKAEKDGLAVKAELQNFATIGWEAMEETDREHRRIPNGILTSNQMRVLGEVVQRYSEDSNADITTGHWADGDESPQKWQTCGSG